MSRSLRTVPEGEAIMFIQSLLPGLLTELDNADKAVQSSENEARDREIVGAGMLAAHSRLEYNTGYRNGVRISLARVAGVLGFTSANWLADLRDYAER